VEESQFRSFDSAQDDILIVIPTEVEESLRSFDKLRMTIYQILRQVQDDILIVIPTGALAEWRNL
jgi:hypothetical protein